MATWKPIDQMQRVTKLKKKTEIKRIVFKSLHKVLIKQMFRVNYISKSGSTTCSHAKSFVESRTYDSHTHTHARRRSKAYREENKDHLN